MFQEIGFHFYEQQIEDLSKKFNRTHKLSDWNKLVATIRLYGDICYGKNKLPLYFYDKNLPVIYKRFK